MANHAKPSQIEPIASRDLAMPPMVSASNVAITHDAIPVRISALPIPRKRNPAWRHIQAQD
ncbi:hypothetical protein [Halomonas sp. N3-2A]|uniref:hypothetical protein n=1 Tax=Halomonas sp. N3-2A TaxID=2014541 RepID=UPI000B5B17FC|nr:hypothetical protein [Halomonas sp. N3-2A]ASK17850.1 hypothetical protein CEK60_00295 [Halomonas sp. N3-2A]